MTAFPWPLPAGLATAGIGAATAAALLLGSRRRAAEHNATPEERAELTQRRRNAWQRRLAVIALGIGCQMMFILAGIAARLSFGAQREYAHAHNGGDWDAATSFALLLDAGALSLSLIRFFEALTLRSSATTRILLLAFVSASAAMNLFHSPGAGAGSAFLAVVPPLVYAVLLEMLLYKTEQVITGRQKRPTASQDRGYSLLLWLPWPIGAPVKLWKAWRSELLATVDNVRVTGSQRPRPSGATEVNVERADPAAVVGITAVSAAPVDALPTNAAQAAAGNADEHPVTMVPPQAASASAPTVPRQGEPEPVTQEAREAPEPTAVVELRLAAVSEAEQDVEPKSAEPAATGSPAALSARKKPLQDGSEDAPGDEEGGKEERAGEKPGLDHDTPPDDEDGEARERRSIDLSTLPKNLTQRQRAERIYLAHQAAGVALSQTDLGKWAGYKNPNSGGNEYRRLEKEHGPIVVRERVTHLNLNQSYHLVTARPPSSAPPGRQDRAAENGRAGPYG